MCRGTFGEGFGSLGCVGCEGGEPVKAGEGRIMEGRGEGSTFPGNHASRSRGFVIPGRWWVVVQVVGYYHPESLHHLE